MNIITRVSATELLKKRGEILRRCYIEKEHFIVENHGLPIAVIIPFAEYQQSPSKQVEIVP